VDPVPAALGRSNLKNGDVCLPDCKSAKGLSLTYDAVLGCNPISKTKVKDQSPR